MKPMYPYPTSRSIRFASALLVLSALALSSCMPPRARPDWSPAGVDRRFALDMPSWQFALPNGIRVQVLPDSSSDVIRMDVRYAVGSLEDPQGRSGLAHLVEHLNFSISLPGQETVTVSDRLGQLALYSNAFTSLDSTHYVAVATRDRLSHLIALEAQRLQTGCTGLDAEVFGRDREIVTNEVKQRLGTGGMQITRVLLDALYPANHPYHRLAGGTMEDLAALTLPDACTFLQDYYTPDRMSVVVAGNVTLDEVRAAATRYLGVLPERPSRPRVVISPARPAWPRRDIEADVDVGSILLVWPLPPQFSRDYEVSMLAARTLGRVLPDKLQAQTAVTGVDLRHFGGVHAPALIVQVTLDDMARSEATLSRLWALPPEIARELDQDRLQMEKARARVGRIADLESLGSRTYTLSDYQQFDPGGGALQGELQLLDSVSLDEVKRRIDGLLAPGRAVVLVVHPSKEKKSTTATSALGQGERSHEDSEDRSASFADEALRPLEVPANQAKAPPAWRFQLANGLNVVLWPHGRWPVVHAELLLPMGSSQEPERLGGLARLAAEEMRPSIAGVHPYDRGPTAEAIMSFFKQGVLLNTSVGDDWASFHSVGLASDADHVIQGLESIVRTGTYDPADFDARRRQLGKILDHPRARTQLRYRLALYQTLYGAGHPYAHSGILTPDSLSRIDVDHAQAFKQALVHAGNATLIVTGAFDPNVIEQHVRYAFEMWPAGGAPIAPLPIAQKRTAPTIFGVVGRDEPTLSLQLAYPAAAGIDSRYPARLVLEVLLTHRLEVIRKKLAASYGISASYSPARGPGNWVIHGELATDRAGEALKAIRKELESVRVRDAAFLSDFARARKTVLRELLASTGSSSAALGELSFLARYQMAPEFTTWLQTSVAALSPDVVLSLVQDELDPRSEIMGLHGSRDALERAFREAEIVGAEFVEVKGR
jgi:zinc protease